VKSRKIRANPRSVKSQEDPRESAFREIPGRSA
jgi:hypothetical protein